MWCLRLPFIKHACQNWFRFEERERERDPLGFNLTTRVVILYHRENSKQCRLKQSQDDLGLATSAVFIRCVMQEVSSQQMRLNLSTDPSIDV